VDEILQDLSNAAPIPTRHGQQEAPSEPPVALASADLVYVRKGGQLQPLAQPYSGPYKGERAQVLPPGHRRQADGGHGGPPETAHGRHSSHAGGPATPGTAPEGAACNTSAPHPVSLARVTSYYRGSPCPPAQGS